MAISAVAYALCDLLHELLGHGAASLLPLGVNAISVSTIGLTTTASSPVVAAAGPLINVALAGTLAVSLHPAVAPSWRYFFWIFGSINAFNATAYLLYSALLGSGDFAVAFGSFAPGAVWRPASAVLGILAYWIAIQVSVRCFRRLTGAGLILPSSVERYCYVPYWTGGLLLTAGAALNPVSPLFILTSGAATGFGAMLGLLMIPSRVRGSAGDATGSHSLHIGKGWMLAGAIAVAVFIGVFGPGLNLAGQHGR